MIKLEAHLGEDFKNTAARAIRLAATERCSVEFVHNEARVVFDPWKTADALVREWEAERKRMNEEHKRGKR
jgi:hypothetical protein